MAQKTHEEPGHVELNRKFAELTLNTLPEHWQTVQHGPVLVFHHPDFPEVINAWERQHKTSKGATTTINHIFSIGTGAVGKDGRKTKIQAITRLPTPDIAALELAAKKGVRIERPVGVFYDGKSLPVSVFEHVEGSTLDKFLDSCPATGDENRRKRLDAISGSLEELGKLHKIRLQHGDASAKNILVSPGGITLIDLMPNILVDMARKGQFKEKTTVRLAAKPHIEDCSRLYASLKDGLTDEEKRLFKGKISDSAVKFHGDMLRNAFDGEHKYTARR